MTAVPVESAASFGKGPQGEAKRWKAEVDLFEQQQANFWTRCGRITKRYRNDTWRDVAGDAEGLVDSNRGFSLLWSNQQTLQPVIYAQEPNANVQRRYKDKDPVARVAATILERCLDYNIDKDDFTLSTRLCRDDFLLVGQGVQWRRYVPHMAKIPQRVGLTPSDAFVDDQGVQISNDAAGYKGEYTTEDDSEFTESDRPNVKVDIQGPYIDREQDAIKTEEICREHVNQRDFGWNPGARTWQEVTAVWRKVYMTRDALIERFGKEKGEKVNLDYSPPKNDGADRADKDFFKKATIYEIWDKATKKALWLAKSFDGDLLDSREDPLKADGFFPCARPLFASQTSDQVTPVPDYLEYQDQAEEMDRLTQKAYLLMDAIKIRGLYAGNIPEIQRLLQDSSNVDFTPVAESIVAMSAGDLSKMVWVWPIKDVVDALTAVLIARDKVKQDAYEVSGIADILRGATDPNETLGAQQLKAQTGAVRIQDRQREMQRWIRDGLRIDADIIMNHFQPETIADIADLSSIPEAAYVQINGEWRDPATGKIAGALPGDQPMIGHNGGPPLNDPAQAGMMPPGVSPTSAPPGAPQVPGGPNLQPPGSSPAMMPGVPQGIPIQPPMPQGPTLGEAAIALLKDPTQRKFRIDIETDSTVALDQTQEKADRNELVGALTQFFEAIGPIVATKPKTIPMFTEILLFAVRGSKAGAALEGTIESTMESLANEPPPQPTPDPALIKAQTDMAIAKQADAREQQKFQAEQANDAATAQREQAKGAMELQADQQRTQMEMAAQAQQGKIDQILAAVELQAKHIDLLIAQQGLKTAEAHTKAAEKAASKPVSNGSAA